LADKRGIDTRVKGEGGEHTQSRSRMVWGRSGVFSYCCGIWILGNYVHACELNIEMPRYLERAQFTSHMSLFTLNI